MYRNVAARCVTHTFRIIAGVPVFDGERLCSGNPCSHPASSSRKKRGRNWRPGTAIIAKQNAVYGEVLVVFSVVFAFALGVNLHALVGDGHEDVVVFAIGSD